MHLVSVPPLLAFAQIDLDPERFTPDGDRLAILGLMVEAYEAEHYPIDPPNPIEAIKFRMDQQGLKPNGLAPPEEDPASSRCAAFRFAQASIRSSWRRAQSASAAA